MDATSVLTGLFTSGRGVDIALGFIALEFTVLFLRAPNESRSKTAFNLVLALGPGVCLMLALRCALTQAHVVWVAFWLAMSLPLHIADIVRRKL
jgi:hypothetical protein